MSNLSENRLNLVLSATSNSKITAGSQSILAELPPNTSLTDEQRLSYSAINVANKVFCDDVLAECQIVGPDIVPAYISVPGIENDLIIFKQLDDHENEVLNVLQRIRDAKRIAGHEAYSACTVVYNAIKTASDAGIPNAKAAYTKLKVRFDVQSSNSAGRAPDQLIIPE